MVAELLGGDGGVGVEGVLGEQCGRLARERHQRRRLAVRFGEVVLEGEALLGGRAQLHDLALHERLERARHLLRHLGVLEAREGDRRAREEIVAREDGRLVRVQLVDGLGAAPRVGGVEDVVVHQRRRVDHLGDRRQGELLPVPLGALAVRVRRRTLRPRVVRLRGRLTHQQHDHRAHALPLPRVPRAEEVLRRLHQRLLVGAQLVAHAARERRNVVGDERERVGGRRRVRRHGVRAVPLQADRAEVAHDLRHVRALNYLQRAPRAPTCGAPFGRLVGDTRPRSPSMPLTTRGLHIEAPLTASGAKTATAISLPASPCPRSYGRHVSREIKLAPTRRSKPCDAPNGAHPPAARSLSDERATPSTDGTRHHAARAVMLQCRVV